LLRDLEDDFTIVNWDERGVGKSYAQLDTDLTLDRVVADAIQLAELLRARFHERRIYVMGESWGSVLGVLAVQQRPGLFHAYIGTGQMVDIGETDRRIYDALLASAERTGDTGVVAQMRGYGPPPYETVWANAYVMAHYEQLVPEWEVLPYVEARYEDDPYGPWGVLGSEYTLVDRVNVLRGLIDYFATLYPQLQQIDFRRDATQLDVPVYLIVGGHELPARADLVPEWFELLEAPEKRLIRFADAGHAPAFEDFRRLERLFVTDVLPDTYSKGASR
jgi:alpha-beta hydrolase superfamily lysophospholipase